MSTTKLEKDTQTHSCIVKFLLTTEKMAVLGKITHRKLRLYFINQSFATYPYFFRNPHNRLAETHKNISKKNLPTGEGVGLHTECSLCKGLLDTQLQKQTQMHSKL